MIAPAGSCEISRMRGANKKTLSLSAGAAWGLLLINSAFAAPSQLRGGPLEVHANSAPARALAGLKSSPPVAPIAPHLDLRLSAAPLGDYPTSTGLPLHRGFAGSAPRSVDMPVFGATAGNGRQRSRLELFARQVHREGLPIARLWENDAALVHLGLSPKGKPGLWLVQKVH
jgi:hypothetical protein